MHTHTYTKQFIWNHKSAHSCLKQKKIKCLKDRPADLGSLCSLHWSTQAAIINVRTGCLSNRSSFSHNSEGWKFNIEVVEGSLGGQDWFLLRLLSSPACGQPSSPCVLT